MTYERRHVKNKNVNKIINKKYQKNNQKIINNKCKTKKYIFSFSLSYSFFLFTFFDLLHRPKRKMRQNVVMIYIFYNYVSNNWLNVLLLFYSLIYLLKNQIKQKKTNNKCIKTLKTL